MDVLYSSCPDCHHRFIPWTVWKITRWSCIKCPICPGKLNRQFELREAAIFYGIFGGLTWLYASGASPAFLVPVGAVLLYVVDVCTVRLTQADAIRNLTRRRTDGR